ncbi:ankyrin repeat-containing protein, putative [Metarhizium acridum CQMa 102]|uniref:Ankyrin repeat-containing protein, putative n=1 Tax=Metarhizium acridum (strain CQMa 102) TaxID=655827 RepID=E9E7H1_METAQ|nr:ankyrin repeat-containing protein, putative [Metarhizium acridum CQMa 102]EFY88081.1 ankyrin repeat-containing protein, putative [Metarhizium acridum CQMa 102]
MVNDELQARIESKVIKASANMFLLAALHMDRLVELRTRQDMMDFLESILGSDLSAAYKKTMEKIENQDQNSVSLAKRTLAWAIHAERPFSVEELRHVLAVRAGSKQFNPGYMPYAREILSVCAGLVTIGNRRGIIRLAHYTTLEFLRQTKPDWLQDMQADLAETCLTYLLYDCFQVGSRKTDQAFEAKFEFYRYAAENWAHHAGIDRSSNACLARKEKIQPLLDVFLATDPLAPSFRYWLFRLKKGIIQSIDRSPSSSKWAIEKLIFSPLSWLSKATCKAYHWSESVIYPPEESPFAFLEAFITASLERASLSDSTWEDLPLGCRKSCTPEAVKKLKVSKNKLSSLLFQASYCHPSLMRHRANTQDFANLLLFFEYHDAPRRCSEEVANLIVILLLKSKAQRQSDTGTKGWTEEEGELFRRLLVKPVHKCQEYQYIPVHSLDPDGDLLFYVIHLGCSALDFLVRSGLDVKAISCRHRFRTPLIAAVVQDLESKTPCVEYLLNHGADVHQLAVGCEYGSALVAAGANAAHYGSQYSDTVRLYIESMATIVKYLLEKGAHVNHIATGMAGAKYLTALAAAVDSGIPPAFSSRRMDDFGAAEITLQQFGFDGKDHNRGMLLSLRAELRESDRGWNSVVAYLKELILEFEEGRIPTPRQTRSDDFGPNVGMTPYSNSADEEMAVDQGL